MVQIHREHSCPRLTVVNAAVFLTVPYLPQALQFPKFLDSGSWSLHWHPFSTACNATPAHHDRVQSVTIYADRTMLCKDSPKLGQTCLLYYIENSNCELRPCQWIRFRVNLLFSLLELNPKSKDVSLIYYYYCTVVLKKTKARKSFHFRRGSQQGPSAYHAARVVALLKTIAAADQKKSSVCGRWLPAHSLISPSIYLSINCPTDRGGGGKKQRVNSSHTDRTQRLDVRMISPGRSFVRSHEMSAGHDRSAPKHNSKTKSKRTETST